MNIRKLTYAEWTAEAKALFGEKSDDWKFVCPLCKTITSIKEWRDNKVEAQIAFSCIGRSNPTKPKPAFANKGGPCDYAGGGLFRMNPVHVTDPEGHVHQLFEFAPVIP